MVGEAAQCREVGRKRVFFAGFDMSYLLDILARLLGNLRVSFGTFRRNEVMFAKSHLVLLAVERMSKNLVFTCTIQQSG
jgi:hypothetical protein